MTTQLQAPPDHASGRAPAAGWSRWAREHLFNTWYNLVLTLVFGGAALAALVGLARMVAGFDLTIVQRNLTLFMVGRFPRDQLWRPWLAGLLLAVAVGLVAGALKSAARERAAHAGLPFKSSSWRGLLRRFWPVIVLVVMILALTQTVTPSLLMLAVALGGVAVYGGGRRLPTAARRWSWMAVALLFIGSYLALAAFGGEAWEGWGGLHLNVFLTLAGILFAFPIGLLLALGRRSSLPALRMISVTYIELVRGVPLISLLLFGAFAIGFLLPETLRPSLVTRMLIAITAFEAAYVAEVVRGGLQAVPRGQTEASQALGMSPAKTMRLIVLPQALRATIPSMVGQFISLYKDTTLVAILGLTELLEASFIVNSQPAFLGKGLFLVTLAFAGLVFWVGSYTMSREARRLEKRLGVGER